MSSWPVLYLLSNDEAAADAGLAIGDLYVHWPTLKVRARLI